MHESFREILICTSTMPGFALMANGWTILGGLTVAVLLVALLATLPQPPANHSKHEDPEE